MKAGHGKASRRRILAIALMVGGLAVAAPGAGGADATSPDRPNIVVIQTDDQRTDDAEFMPKLQQLIADQGTTFSDSIVSLSHCCPSRATLLTGQYAKNHGVLTSAEPVGGYAKLKPTLGNTLPVWLQSAGYKTGLIGKFLNGYKENVVPPGWDEWYGAFEAGAYGFTLYENPPGKRVAYGVNHFIVDPANYNTDVYTRKAEDFIARRAPSDDPFYLYVGTFAPHTECGGGLCSSDPRAAPRDENSFANQPLPKTPNWNEADVSDKPQQARNMAAINANAEKTVTRLYRDRLESLQAVDDLIEGVVDELEATGELDDTVIIFHSDNGLLLGEHRLKADKVWPYQESLGVPLMMRGPGIPAGATRDELVSNVDLAPTILDLAGGTAGRPQDGKSILPLAHGDTTGDWDRPIFIEGHYNERYEYLLGPRIVFNGVRTKRYTYALHVTGEEELYDHQVDPWELSNKAADPAYAAVKAQLRAEMDEMKACAGASCSSVDVPTAVPGR